jgi:hypothetical protein
VTDVTEEGVSVTAITEQVAGSAHLPPINNGAAKRGQWELTMTASFTNKVRQAGLVLGFALSLSALTSTQSFAFSEEARAQCTGDAFKLCSSDIPNVPAITACMMKHRAQLSTGCRTVMDKDLAASHGKKVAATN